MSEKLIELQAHHADMAATQSALIAAQNALIAVQDALITQHHGLLPDNIELDEGYDANVIG